MAPESNNQLTNSSPVPKVRFRQSHPKPRCAVFASKDKNGKRHRIWRYRYLLCDGKSWRFGSGVADKAATKRIAEQLAREQFEIRIGLRPSPKPENEYLSKPWGEVVSEYLAWGNSVGADGKPWSNSHSVRVTGTLHWWIKHKTHWKTLRDVNRMVVERVIQQLQKQGKTGKTLSNYQERLRAFLNWCVDREILDDSPLRKMSQIDTSVRNPRRALNPDEVGKLLVSSPPDRALMYRVACETGFRARELDSLRVMDFNVEQFTIFLRADFAKDRRSITVPVSSTTSKLLAESIQGRTLYDKLLPCVMLHHTAKYFHQDCKRAGIPRIDPRNPEGGMLCFHSLRMTHIQMGLTLGFDAKTVQTLARHKTIDLTMNVYAKSHADRMREAVEKLGDFVESVSRPINSAKS